MTNKPLSLLAFAFVMGTAGVAEADPLTVDITSLKILLEKKIISQEEYDAALKDIQETSGKKAGDATTLAVGKFATTIYGFVEADFIHDSTQSYNEQSQNSVVARNESFGGNNGRTQFSDRNSRLGFRIKAPEFAKMMVSGQLEMDFFSNQVGIGYPAAAGQQSENSFYVNPLFRIRHMNIKLETPIVDVLFGQYWDLFGFQPNFHPNTVQIQGVLGEVYSRTPQIRISKMLGAKKGPVQVELAIAAMRPVERDGETPEGQAGIRLAVNAWKGAQTTGSTGTGVNPAGLAVSGDLRRINVPDFVAGAKTSREKGAAAMSIDAFIPILPAKMDEKNNIVGLTPAGSLSLNGNFVTGYGIADLYSGLTGGITFPALPNPTGAVPAPVYPQNIDNGIATFDPSGALHFVQWTSYIMGLQYYLPGVNGKVWISGNYMHIESSNTTTLVPAAGLTKVLASADMVDGNVFLDLLPGFRLGVEFARNWSLYGDGQKPINDRVQGSAFFIF